MKIETKFNIGDSVYFIQSKYQANADEEWQHWYICQNKYNDYCVQEIKEIKIDSSEITYYSNDFKSKKENIFKTYEEAMNECINRNG